MDVETWDGPRPASSFHEEGNRLLDSARAKLSRDLHDGVGQSLNTLLVRIRLSIAKGAAGMDELKILELTAQQALAGARALAYGLREAGKIDPIGDARDYAQRTLADAGCSLVWRDERGRLPLAGAAADEVAIAIKESTTNIARHARASAAWITLDVDNGGLRVAIRDDGVGFDPAAIALTPDGRGLGLLGNRERLTAVGGTFTVESAPGAGTTVVLEVPSPTSRSVERHTDRVGLGLDLLVPELSVAAG